MGMTTRDTTKTDTIVRDTTKTVTTKMDTTKRVTTKTGMIIVVFILMGFTLIQK